MTKEEFIQSFDKIWPLSIELKLHLAKILKETKLRRKQYLLQAGDTSRKVYFINLGLVRAFYIKKDVEISSWFMKEGDVIFSVNSFYNQAASYEYIQCLEASEFYYITYDELQFIYKHFIEFNYIRAILTEKYYALSEERLRSMRLQNANERCTFLLENHSDLIVRVPLKHLATYMGIRVETLSRAINK